MIKIIEYKGLQKLIAEHLSVDVKEVLPDSHMADDLGGDSLDMVELMMSCEEKYGIEIPDEVAETLYTPQKMFDYLMNPN